MKKNNTTKLCWFGCVLFFYSCIPNPSEINHQEIECPALSHNITYEDSIHIQTVYDSCEPFGVYNLRCLINNTPFFIADSLIEFEFYSNSKQWPQFKRVNKNNFQLLLEQNKRPGLNEIMLLTVTNGFLFRTEIIPCLNSSPEDYDDDGVMEFAGFFEPIELSSPDSVIYNPILCYENRENGFLLDSMATKLLNQKIWGLFRGYKFDENIVLPKPTTYQQYFNVKQ